ncbi:MAG: hypothetical protein IJB34_04350 [Clostridia bacterium]|nr:hypothetical protein [Clostridia bacterium]
MDKQKQIEEIEKEYKKWAVGLLKVRFDLKPEAFDEHHKNNYSFENCADCLWNKIKGSIEELLWLKENQLPENAVVLTQKELIKMQLKYYNGGAEQTAEKFAERVKLKVKELDLGGWIEVATGSMYKIVDEIAKEITGNDKMSLKRARIDAGGETRRK